MTGALDLGTLKAHAACAEGLTWMQARGGSVPLDETVEATVVAEPSFAVWSLFHLPEVRASLGAERLATLAGPRHGDLVALFDDLRGASYLHGAGDDAVIQAAVEAHLQALAPLVPSQPFVPSLPLISPVPITRTNLTDAWALCPPADTAFALPPPEWVAGWWTACGEASGALSVIEPMENEPRVAIRAWLRAQLEPIRPVAEWVERFVGAAAFKGAFRGARSVIGPGVGGRWEVCRAAANAARQDAVDEALWCLADVEAPSPFAPLVRLWRHGVWPAGLVGGAFIVGVAEAADE